MSEEGMLIEKHSVGELFETLEQIKTQTTRTNGRVLELEKRSVGLWMANHQAKSALIFVSLPCILISDIRHPVVEFVVGLFF